MAVSTKKKKTFAEACVLDHKKVIASSLRKIASENGWRIAELAAESKASKSTASFVLRGDEHIVSLEKLCLMSYELGIAIGMRIVNPNV